MDTQRAMAPRMTIGALARRLGVTARALRYYERIGLLVPTSRTASGYRLYSEQDAQRLAFIRRAQAFGLSLDEIVSVLAVRDGGAPPCHHVRTLAETRIQAIDARLAELLALRGALAHLAENATSVESACASSGAICLAFDDAVRALS